MITRILLIVSFLSVTAFAVPPDRNDVGGEDRSSEQSVQDYDNTQYLNVSYILMFVTNHGSFGRDLSGVFGYGYGTFFPYISIDHILSGTFVNSPLFAAGPWLGGTVDGQVRVAISEYSDEYVPGPMVDGAFLPDQPAFKVYKLYRDSLEANPNADYLQWPIDQGAPVDGEGRPVLRGDQMVWTVFNDADPNQHTNGAGRTEPLGVEIQLCAWGWNGSAVYDGVVFLEYKLINKGANVIEDFHFGLWSDPDVGGSSDDMVGCLPDQNMFFAYNFDNDDDAYGNRPAAIGFKVDGGPVVQSADSIAYIDGKPIPNYLSLPLSGFARIINGTDPDTPTATYCYLQGLNRTCQPYIIPGTTTPTPFMYAGDPVEGTGALDEFPADKRMLGSIGPFTFLPGDTQTINLRMALQQGSDRLSSVSWVENRLAYPASITYNAQTSMTTVLNTPLPDDTVRIYVGDLDFFTVDDINPSTLFVNGASINCVTTILPSHPQFTGSVMEIALTAQDFLDSYKFNSGEQIQPYGLYFTIATHEAFVAIGEVVMVDMFMGDLNGDRAVDISDLTYFVNSLFLLGPDPVSMEAANLNCDEAGAVDITDLTLLVNHLFLTFEPLLPCP